MKFLAPRYWPTWLGLGLLWVTVKLPFGAVLAVGRGIGRMAWLLPLPYQHIARTNMALCLPDLNDQQRHTLLLRHFESLGIGLLESAMTWWSTRAHYRAVDVRRH